MLAWYGRTPTWGIVLLPVFLLLTALTALAFGLGLSVLHVRYRDVGYVTPFLIQVWMYASPIMYPVSLVPEKWRGLYGLNPMAGVIGGFRWAMLGTEPPPFDLMAASTLVVLAVLGSGIVYFKRMESTFADVI
jgi:lipopolysaccharide transport system permease protein